MNNFVKIVVGVVVLFVLVLICFFVMYNKKSVQPQQEHDTFYYNVEDINGTVSCKHDLGIRPSETPPHSIIILKIAKKEYNDGIPKNINTPKFVKMGMHYHNLKWELTPENIKDEGDYYSFEVKVPHHGKLSRKEEVA